MLPPLERDLSISSCYDRMVETYGKDLKDGSEDMCLNRQLRIATACVSPDHKSSRAPISKGAWRVFVEARPNGLTETDRDYVARIKEKIPVLNLQELERSQRNWQWAADSLDVYLRKRPPWMTEQEQAAARKPQAKVYEHPHERYDTMFQAFLTRRMQGLDADVRLSEADMDAARQIDIASYIVGHGPILAQGARKDCIGGDAWEEFARERRDGLSTSDWGRVDEYIEAKLKSLSRSEKGAYERSAHNLNEYLKNQPM